MSVLYNDNSENAFIAVKIVMELFKAFRQELESHAQQFIDFTIKFYNQFPSIAKTLEEDIESERRKIQQQQLNRKQRQKSSSEREDDDDDDTRPLTPSMASCKVLMECPFLVVLLFQTYQKPFAEKNLHQIVQCMLAALEIEFVQRPPISASKEIKQRYSDYFHSQVKVRMIIFFPEHSTLFSRSFIPMYITLR